MTAKIKQIIGQLNDLAMCGIGKSASVDDFISSIAAFNLLSNIPDAPGIDRAGLQRKIAKLYPLFSRQVLGDNDIRHTLLLLKVLYHFVIGCDVDSRSHTSKMHRNALMEMCNDIVNTPSATTPLSSYDHLCALCYSARLQDYFDPAEYKEIKSIIDSYLDGIDNAMTEEKLLRLNAYDESKSLISTINREKWESIRESLLDADIRHLDDDKLVLWTNVTNLAPVNELKRRASHSKRMQLEYLRALLACELEKERKLVSKRMLARDLKTLNDDIIADIIPIEIRDEMSLPTLHAIETILYLRLQLAQVGWEEKEPIYNSLCRIRFEQIASTLKRKYGTTSSFNEKIEILERIQNIELLVDSTNSHFTIDEAKNLLQSTDAQHITISQRLRLEWITGIEAEDCSKNISELLPQANEAFDIATLSLIQDFGTNADRRAIFDRFTELAEAAIKHNDTYEIGRLIATSACWNVDPTTRQKITEVTGQTEPANQLHTAIQSQQIDLPLPLRRLLPIAAEIHTRIDIITGKYRHSA